MEFDGMKEMEDEVSVRPREESEEDSDLWNETDWTIIINIKIWTVINDWYQ